MVNLGGLVLDSDAYDPRTPRRTKRRTILGMAGAAVAGAGIYGAADRWPAGRKRTLPLPRRPAAGAMVIASMAFGSLAHAEKADRSRRAWSRTSPRRSSATICWWSTRPAGDARCRLFRRLIALFVPDSRGRRPIFGANEILQTHPDWKDLIVFPEYFHGDNGAGLGAWHQTGWSALVVDLILTLPSRPGRSGRSG